MFGIKVELPPPSIQFLHTRHFVTFFDKITITQSFRREKQMPKDLEYRWYVDPCRDPYSNEVVAIRLSTIGNVVEQHLEDEDRHLRGVYEIDRHIMKEFYTAKNRDKNLKLKFFVRRGNGKIREWKFEDRKRDSAEMRKVKGKLEALKK